MASVEQALSAADGAGSRMALRKTGLHRRDSFAADQRGNKERPYGFAPAIQLRTPDVAAMWYTKEFGRVERV